MDLTIEDFTKYFPSEKIEIIQTKKRFFKKYLLI